MNGTIGAEPTPNLAEAAAIWVGYGSRSSPSRDDQAVLAAFEPRVAEELLAQLKVAEQEFYRSDAWARARNLSEMGTLARADFSALRPGAPQELSEVLAWCYTFDYK